MNELTAAFKEYATGTLLVLDLLGTFVFALSGAVVGVKRRLDIFGVLVLSFAAATAGGITRDLLIGFVPPAAIRDWRYMAVSLLGGLLIFVWFPRSQRTARVRNFVLLFDAGGLALFAVTGTQKALGFGLHPLMAPLLGMLTGIGGGMMRDILVAETPYVLRTDLYAVAALAGAVVVVLGHYLGLAPIVTAGLGAVICFGLRLIAIRRRWQLPVAHSRSEEK
ncbi:MAG TPA: trimeric intracellular cation channel family protein [Pyrinomonadaceae bacterium]|nr:trimeric intracellular cation channel family protein [Pyrinomonadaceae bacterium]